MTCKDCRLPLSVEQTLKGDDCDVRIQPCGCGSRWLTEARIIRRLQGTHIQGTGKANTGQIQGASPSPSGGGIGGPLPLVPVLSPVSPDPNSTSSLLSNQTRGRARSKTPANPNFAPMRDTFVGKWEGQYQDKYIFQPKDGAGLAKMLLSAPHLVERWPDMVSRYLADAFWASKRHPLTGLVTRPVEFAGETRNGVPTKVAASRETTKSWVTRNAG